MIKGDKFGNEIEVGGDILTRKMLFTIKEALAFVSITTVFGCFARANTFEVGTPATKIIVHPKIIDLRQENQKSDIFNLPRKKRF